MTHPVASIPRGLSDKVQRPPAQYLAAYQETGSATRAAQLLGCSKRVVYAHLHRAGIAVRPYRRLRLVLPAASDPLREWEAARLRAIDAELARLRARWEQLLTQAAQTNGREQT